MESKKFQTKNASYLQIGGDFSDSFNKLEVLKRTGKNLKHVREVYSNKLV
jgi:hypothetical protein